MTLRGGPIQDLKVERDRAAFGLVECNSQGGPNPVICRTLLRVKAPDLGAPNEGVT